MKAVQIESYGGPEILKLNEVTEPGLVGAQILVEVHAASINRFDKTLISGILKDNIPLSFPFTMGGDFAGVVKAVGAGVGDFRPGDEVYGTAMALGAGTGAFAESLSVNLGKLSLKPKKANFEEAASLVLVGVSALQALTEHIGLLNEQKILIQGGAGGIGHIAIQIANSLGAHVSTVVASEDVGFVRSLGATGVVDYKTQEFEKVLAEYDAVLDTVGGEVTNRSLNVLRKGGVLVTLAGVPDENLAKQKEIITIKQNTEVNTERLKKLTQLVDSGKVKVNVDKVFPLFEAQKAFDFLINNHTRGKVALKVRS